VEAGDWALADIQAVVAQVLATDGGLLSAGEAVVARRVLALDGDAGRLWARLVGRRPKVFRVSGLRYPDVADPVAALATLRGLDLVHGAVPERLQLACYTVPELRRVCERVGLAGGGKRPELLARLQDQRGWASEPVVRVCCGALVRRLEALCFQDRWRDRSVWLLDRLGVTRWPSYALTSREPAFARRRTLLAWADGPPGQSPPEALLAQLATLTPRPSWQRRLCLRRRLERRVIEDARGLERTGDPARAARLYQGLLDAGTRSAGAVTTRLALALEATGDRVGALAAARRWRPLAEPVARPGLDRVGRRLARRARGTWPPEPPLQAPPQRRLLLVRAASKDHRPRWGDPGLSIEAAVARSVPRSVLQAENALWTTLAGLLLYDLLWLDVPGMLPRPHLAGPLDLGTADFARHRQEALADRLQALQDGRGPALLRAAWAHHGERIRGVHWGRWSLGALEACVAGVGGRPLALILGRLAHEGWSAATGLPDLVVLPGPRCRLSHGFPSRLGEGLVLVEVKGPHDTVRDAQAVWFDHLLRAGAQIELWRVEARSDG